MYEVLIERTAERDLKSLPTNLFDRIVPRIKALAETPRRRGLRYESVLQPSPGTTT